MQPITILLLFYVSFGVRMTQLGFHADPRGELYVLEEVSLCSPLWKFPCGFVLKAGRVKALKENLWKVAVISCTKVWSFELSLWIFKLEG